MQGGPIRFQKPARTSGPPAGTLTSALPKVMARRALLRRVQIALKPASKTLGLHGIFIRGKGLKYMSAGSAFKRVQVDARTYWRDAGEPHRGPALRTGRTLNWGEWNDGRQELRHDPSLNTGGSTTLSVTGNARGRGVIAQVCASGALKGELIRGCIGGSRHLAGILGPRRPGSPSPWRPPPEPAPEGSPRAIPPSRRP